MNQPVTPNVQNNSPGMEDDDSIDLAEYLDLLIESRWLIAGVALVVTLLGGAYALMATPIYQSNLLVQVEDGGASGGMMLGDLAGAFEMKSAATAEIEIIRSRYVVGRAASNAQLDLSIMPKRFPLFGGWIARNQTGLSEPGIFGMGGYTWGAEQAQISTFTVPAALEGKKFVLIAGGNNAYTLSQDAAGIDVKGRVGETLSIKTVYGSVAVYVAQLDAKAGAAFTIVRQPLLETVERLQESLVISEKGKQSGILGVSLEGADRLKTADTLNEIGRQYLRQNVERKSEEAEKSLAFLEKQLPEMKRNLELAEEKYNALRNSRGTVDLGEEAKSVLQQSVLSQTRLIELKQKRDELLTRYQPNNPLVVAVTQQMQTLNSEIGLVNERIRKMPQIEQDVLRLTRDIKVNTDLYTSLLNSAQQLRLVKASKVGNVRLIDDAVVPLEPVRPKRSLVVVMALLIGVLFGIVCAFIKKSLFGGVEDPGEVERMLGLPISAAIPHSAKQEALHADMNRGAVRPCVLAQEDPTELAVEALRSFRTASQFSLMGAKNKIIMITGPTPGVGKSFVSVNFAAVLASTGKKVLLIDGDLRKGYLQRYFGLKRVSGLSEIMLGHRTFDTTVHNNVVENLDFLSTGVLPPRPAELLEHSNFAQLLVDVAERYDFVVIDTAPVLAVTDALIVASHVGVIFNVVRGNVSTIGEVGEAVKRLRQAGNNVAGIVFNGLKHRLGRYGFGSKYGKYRYAQYKY
ncbi:tyrosine-protein kinase involved in EPS biosynthesis [Massilia varians]|uniref:Tyrosine-protein kinase involved in EPS biosynthesis n=1 Tax=Massilia varians TaxID=457921 RepID=A0ABN6TEJ1_9BURK|nr:polysaccharide biosynthesis tyrosine autokinase [Massilia varians]BDT60636.1 tyrosine-protein kinase involved in EPS biosynthesis [Massilia varians]